MKTYAALAVGVAAGLVAAPITLTASATTTADTCGQIITEARHVDHKLWRNTNRHDGRPTTPAVNRWRVDTLYLEAWARTAGC